MIEFCFFFFCLNVQDAISERKLRPPLAIIILQYPNISIAFTKSLKKIISHKHENCSVISILQFLYKRRYILYQIIISAMNIVLVWPTTLYKIIWHQRLFLHSFYSSYKMAFLIEQLIQRRLQFGPGSARIFLFLWHCYISLACKNTFWLVRVLQAPSNHLSA